MSHKIDNKKTRNFHSYLCYIPKKKFKRALETIYAKNIHKREIKSKISLILIKWFIEECWSKYNYFDIIFFKGHIIRKKIDMTLLWCYKFYFKDFLRIYFSEKRLTCFFGVYILEEVIEWLYWGGIKWICRVKCKEIYGVWIF